ncbi:hypothetical protein NP233_g6549 [Leucocoprinus birnbaumii]|uniref:C2 domain-containing protein n=1 Tax=Leucocoprinus birnbaumii TaxID=56174 RepID=A0AAD5VQU9_9AGAR|nr:hypothetical protein NP233_g6549 [Leucocoprinus birnbaumii]
MAESEIEKLVQQSERQDDLKQPTGGHARAIGAVRIQLQSAHLKKTGPAWLRWLFPKPNPFVEISINDTRIVGCSKQVCNTHDPYWFPQAFHALIYSSQDSIGLSVFSSRSKHWRTKLLGKASYDMCKLERDLVHLGISERLWKRGEEGGILLFDLVLYKPTSLRGTEDDTSKLLFPETTTNGFHCFAILAMGVMDLFIYEAKGLSSGDILASQLRPGVVVSIEMNGKDIVHSTPKGFSENPRWHSHCEILALQGRRTRLILEVKDGRTEIGHINLPIGDILRGEEQDGRWWPLSGSPQGRLRIKTGWKALSGVHEDVAGPEI